MALDPHRNATEQLREKEEKARRDRERYLRQQRELGMRRGSSGSGEPPPGGKENYRDRDR
jgi:hypothetical protein